MIIIAGGSGFVGTHLCYLLLQQGYEVGLLTRQSRKVGKFKMNHKVTYFFWNPDNEDIDMCIFENATAIVNLTGAGVLDKRWTSKRKKIIETSRTISTIYLAKLVSKLKGKSLTFVQASAIGFYGEDKGSPFEESMLHSNDFLGNTCKKWEESLNRLDSEKKVRAVILRIAFVFALNGGFFNPLRKLLNLRINPIFHKGTQYWSWIHINDLCNMILFAIENQSVCGTYNAAANFTPQKQLNQIYNQSKKTSCLPFRIPRFFLQLMLGERGIELLKSCRVSNQKIVDAGYQFTYPTVQSLFKHE